MAADIVPIGLRLTKGDVHTLWAPRWRADGDEWEAFLGKDEDLYVFDSVADLTAFVRTDRDNEQVVENFDLLAPAGFGGIIGGSVREDDHGRLLARVQGQGLKPETYDW